MKTQPRSKFQLTDLRYPQLFPTLYLEFDQRLLTPTMRQLIVQILFKESENVTESPVTSKIDCSGESLKCGSRDPRKTLRLSPKRETVVKVL
jgi:hypothetical protein